jgi:hypothetical protein
LDDGLADASERVGTGSPRALAGIEHDKAQGAVIMQHSPETLRRDQTPVPRLIAQDKNALLGFAIEAAMPDEMQNVIFTAAQFSAQRRKGCFREKIEFHLSAALRLC